MSPAIATRKLPPPAFTREEPRASARVDRPASGLVLVTIAGEVPAAWSPDVADAIRSELARGPSVNLFWDLEHLESYDASLRQLCTDVLLAHRKNLTSVHALARSRVVSMGVSVANLVLGGIITSYRERPTFESAIEAVLLQTPVA